MSRPRTRPARTSFISAPSQRPLALPPADAAALSETGPRRPGRPRRIGVLLVLLAGASFGTMPLFARVAYASGAGPSSALFARFGLATVCMLALMAARRTAFPRGRDLALLIMLGSVVYVGQSLSYFLALKHTSAGVASLVVYVYPALVTAFATVVQKEPLTRKKVVAIGLSLAGCALTVGPLHGAGLLGIGLAFTSAVIYAIYVVSGTRLAGRAGAVAATTVILGSAAVSYGGILAATGTQWPQTPVGWAALAALAVISTVVPALAFLAGMQRIGPVAASTIASVEPLMTVALAALFLGEVLGGLQMLGGALIVTAVMLIARP